MKWQPHQRLQHRIAPRHLRAWLLDRGSLTDKLVAASHGRFRVEVLRQVKGVARWDEARLLGLRERQAVLIREVLLYGNNIPWVYARSILPEKSLAHSLKYLKRLGNKPLGAVLFNNPHMHRGVIELALHIPGEVPVALTAPTWGRRSVFYLQKQPLLVSEVFLPTLAP